MLNTTNASAGAVTLPEPDEGSVDRSLLNIGGSHTSIGGSTTLDTFARKRTWMLAWSAVDATAASTGLYNLIMQFWSPDSATFKGYGPFWFNDPQLSTRTSQVNIMSVAEPSKALKSSALTITIQEI